MEVMDFNDPCKDITVTGASVTHALPGTHTNWIIITNPNNFMIRATLVENSSKSTTNDDTTPIPPRCDKSYRKSPKMTHIALLSDDELSTGEIIVQCGSGF